MRRRPTKINTALSRNISLLLAHAGISLNALAAETGLVAQTVGLWKQGRGMPGRDNLFLLADAFSRIVGVTVTVDELCSTDHLALMIKVMSKKPEASA